MGNYMNIKNKGFDKRPENINRKGRPISIKQDLKNILGTEGEINIKSENIISINKNGSVTVKMPTSESLAMKLLQIANRGKNTTTLKAIQIVLDQIDGRPKQSIGFELGDIKPLENIRLPPRESKDK